MGLEVVGNWLKEPRVEEDFGFRRNPQACIGRKLGDCYFKGKDSGLAVDVFFGVDVLVTSGVLQCEDTEACDKWTVNTDEFYKTFDFTVSRVNPGITCGSTSAIVGLKKMPLTCPAVFAADIYTKVGSYKALELETAKAYVAGLTPEQRANLCRATRN